MFHNPAGREVLHSQGFIGVQAVHSLNMSAGPRPKLVSKFVGVKKEIHQRSIVFRRIS